jgi:predicted transcriptional regulator
MVKLTLNEEKVRKELVKFPNGAKAVQIMNELVMTKSPLYVALNRLEDKGLAFRGEHGLWYSARAISVLPISHQVGI